MAIKELLLYDISITNAYKKYTIPKTTFYRYIQNIIDKDVTIIACIEKVSKTTKELILIPSIYHKYSQKVLNT
jgi:hypothetical protein